MPQFDFSTYSSQIFWFILCFAVFYYFVSTKILPRIESILEERKKNIQLNQRKSEALNKDYAKLQGQSEDLKNKSVLEYKNKIEAAKNDLKLQREQEINGMKRNIEEMNKNSKAQIAKVLDSSKLEFEKSIQTIANTISKKITN